MKTSDYVTRIGLDGSSLEPNIESLRLLQRSHLLSVPFENLDIHWSRPITLDRERFYAKIVSSRRGGFCYELNGLFDTLLQEIGFKTRLVSARVYSGEERGHGPEFDHAAIIVTIDGKDFLADVGFGSFSAEPLVLNTDGVQVDPSGEFLIRKREDDYFEVLRREKGIWTSEYMFRDVAHDLSDFAEMCDFQQYSPDSHFRKGKLCSIMTATGRKTLTDKSFIITANGQKHETPVDSDAEFYSLLSTEFGIESAQT